MKMLLLILAVSLCVAAFSSSVTGQTATTGDTHDDDSTNASPGLKFRGQPLPYCKAYIIAEFSYLTRLNTKPKIGLHETGKWYLTGDLGLMINVNRKWSVGSVFAFGGDDDSGRFGFMPRVRRWLTNPEMGKSAIRLDLTAGPLLSITDNYLNPSTPGWMANVSLNFHDWFALTAQMEIIKYKWATYVHTTGYDWHYETGSDTDVAWYIGAKGVSYGGLIGLAVFVGIYAISEATSSSW